MIGAHGNAQTGHHDAGGRDGWRRRRGGRRRARPVPHAERRAARRRCGRLQPTLAPPDPIVPRRHPDRLSSRKLTAFTAIRPNNFGIGRRRRAIFEQDGDGRLFCRKGKRFQALGIERGFVPVECVWIQPMTVCRNDLVAQRRKFSRAIEPDAETNGRPPALALPAGSDAYCGISRRP